MVYVIARLKEYVLRIPADALSAATGSINSHDVIIIIVILQKKKLRLGEVMCHRYLKRHRAGWCQQGEFGQLGSSLLVSRGLGLQGTVLPRKSGTEFPVF